jgi:hypothetical protein
MDISRVPPLGSEVLDQLIFGVLFEPIYSAVAPLHGHWASLYDSLGDFFWLLGLQGVSGLVLAAPVAFGLQGLLVARAVSRRRKVIQAAALAVAYPLLGGLMQWIASLGSADQAGPWYVVYALSLFLPRGAYSVFGFWLPALASSAYVTFSKRPKWWVAAVLATVVLILGVWLWMVVGTLVGAETD